MDKRSLWALYQMDASNKSKASGKHPTRLELSVSHVFPIWRVHDTKLKVAVAQERFFFAFFAPPPPSPTWKMSRRQFSSPIRPCRCAWWRLGVDLTFSLFLEKSQRAGDQTHDFWFLHIHVEVNDGESLFTATPNQMFFSMFYLVVCEEDLMRFHQKLQPKDDVHMQLNIIHMYVFYT